MSQASLLELIDIAKSGGGLVSFPTDTVPALATRPDRANLIYEAKQRSQTKPLILMGGTIEDLWSYVAGPETERAIWQQVAEKYWPGALTLVLPSSDQLPRAMNPTDPTTIGIRVPNHPIARHILTLTGPLATTSVNRSGEPALQTLEEINAQFPEIYTLSPDALKAIEAEIGSFSPQIPQNSGLPSTVAKWTGQGWEILRQGEVVIEG